MMWSLVINDGEARRYLKCPTKVSTMLRLFLRHCVKIVRKTKKDKVHSQVHSSIIRPALLTFTGREASSWGTSATLFTTVSTVISGGPSLSLYGVTHKAVWVQFNVLPRTNHAIANHSYPTSRDSFTFQFRNLLVLTELTVKLIYTVSQNSSTFLLAP